tara:strand:- start:1026 stop:1184 length:159 start_codon:yes stop_codon:yes gene_type:complete
LFEYCNIINKKCAFAGEYRGNIHCGLKTGTLFETKIMNMNKCPKKPKKNAKR